MNRIKSIKAGEGAQAQNHPIRAWAKDERPREKLRDLGPAVLSNAELVALLLGGGTRSGSAVDVARSLLALAEGNLSQLGRLSVGEMMRVPGVGLARAVSLAAALELGRRRQGAAGIRKPVVTASADVAPYLRARLSDYRHEVFAVVFLNRANKINGCDIISVGGLTGTVADPRVILRRALESDAVSLILCHNHPSGSLKPSRADEELTHKIRAAAAHFDIRVLDHLIVSEEGYFSFADEGIL